MYSYIKNVMDILITPGFDISPAHGGRIIN